MSRSTANWLFVGGMAVVGVVLAHPSMLVHDPGLNVILNLGGAIISAMGLWLRVIARQNKVEHVGLVTTGPYAVIRHPLYVGSLLTGTGLALILGSIPFLAVFIVGFTLIHSRIARSEEDFLRKEFPEQFTAYEKSVPGWIPQPKAVVRLIRDRKTWMLICADSIRRECSAICGAIAGGFLLETWADVSLYGWSTTRTEGLITGRWRWLRSQLGFPCARCRGCAPRLINAFERRYSLSVRLLATASSITMQRKLSPCSYYYQ
jgi:protein-S-isoprenylcysteine O-methyltransferase Ste14